MYVEGEIICKAYRYFSVFPVLYCPAVRSGAGADRSAGKIQELPGVPRDGRKHSHEECQGEDGHV